MGYSLQIDDAEDVPLASNAGWGDVVKWAESLDANEYGELRHLVEYGWSDEYELLIDQISVAMQHDSPESEETAHTVEGLADSLSAVDGAEVVTVTDGLGEDNGEDDNLPIEEENNYQEKAHGPHVPLPLAAEVPAGKSDSLRNNRQLPAVGIVRQSEHIYSREKSGADDAREGEREKPIKEMIVRLQAVFDRQRKDIQEHLVGRKSAPLPRDVMAILEQYAAQIADAVAPAMEAQVVAGGHAGLEGIELPPDVFNVTNPAVRQFIDKYTIRLAGEVNDYTGKLLSETLGEGLDAGESATQLSARVGALYDDFSGYRTEMIARTESARAFCAGNEEAWKQSNVVKGKAWDLAAGGCPICQAISERFGEHGVALDQPFFPLGSSIPLADGKTFSVDYSPIMGPPGHPHCRCALKAVLKESE